ncbi:MAG: cobalamin biosynthesis protein CbiD [Lachnospiraceae bacterium]|nr:cobalamin biosynthesis protein CbiD [Lachnospiraceae bacterium]
MSLQTEDKYVIKNNKKLRRGYTTGSCAAAAAKGAAMMLLGGDSVETVDLMTPRGIPLKLSLENIRREGDRASCGVVKDGGDDPDATHGLLICAQVSKSAQPGIHIDGGQGVGRVTVPGLDQPPGAAAINHVPREMIVREVQGICRQYGYEGGIQVLVTVPSGVETAKKTFNPRLGIEGGISILGTTGIVEPMSEQALVKSIEVEMNVRIAQGGQALLVTPGNYGEAFLKEHMSLPFEKNMKCSNYIGETIDLAVEKGVQGILFVGHIGKLIKVAGGIMNTHSHCADSRCEIMAANALRAGISREGALAILQTKTTDEALDILDSEQVLEPTMERIADKIQFYLEHRSYSQIELGAVFFSSARGYLGETRNARELMKKI